MCPPKKLVQKLVVKMLSDNTMKRLIVVCIIVLLFALASLSYGQTRINPSLCSQQRCVSGQCIRISKPRYVEFNGTSTQKQSQTSQGKKVAQTSKVKKQIKKQHSSCYGIPKK